MYIDVGGFNMSCVWVVCDSTLSHGLELSSAQLGRKLDTNTTHCHCYSQCKGAASTSMCLSVLVGQELQLLDKYMPCSYCMVQLSDRENWGLSCCATAYTCHADQSVAFQRAVLSVASKQLTRGSTTLIASESHARYPRACSLCWK